MKVFKKIADISKEIDSLKAENKTIGFVPTMGALHAGHLSLIQRSKKETDITVASIFVNPTQFNNKEDLKNYPRTMESDVLMLESVGCDILFAPDDHEMYPEPDTRIFDFGNIDKVMEGAFRPGHFNGVGQIVSKLFQAVKPHKAFFGQKDFQQLAVIKQLCRKYLADLSIEIVACEIIRESDGLAMSSRNALLTVDYRQRAVKISQTLFKAVEISRNYSVSDLKKWVIEQINVDEFLKVEYFEIVDDTYLKTIEDWKEPNIKIGCIAVFAGKVRLIDNVTF